MISFNLKSSLAIGVICFVLGCCITFLLFGGCNDDALNENLVKPEVLQQKADSIEACYQIKITELTNKNQQLQTELSATKVQLNAIKAKTKTKAATIKKMIAPQGYPAKELLKKIDPASVVMDSSLSPCDSLVQEVSGYIQDNELKDSLYELQIALQDNIIAGKDSIIAIKTSQYNELSTVFDQSIKQQEILFSENKSLRKQVKRQKRKGRLLALGTAILSGLATHYLTQ
ncbi:MAG: hypothetical protein BGO54_13785 [Sphingobacteriales bacterium 46-32]|nr:MAG: hypothetical protein BGO54_13785 [Sphingobacteriales bacterium 46-32]